MDAVSRTVLESGAASLRARAGLIEVRRWGM
jgi:hypothetical protein